MRASASHANFIVLGLFVAGAGCGSSGAHGSTAGTGGSSTGASSSSSSGSSSSGSHASSSSASSSSSGSSSSGSSSSGIVVDGGPVGNFPFPPVTYQGGTIVAAPDLVTITFAGDTLASQLATFGAPLASTAYWDTIRAGYCGGGVCVGDGPAGTAVALTTAPAASYTDSDMGGASTIQTFLSGLISANTVPAPTDNTVYMIYFPATTSISLDGSPSCGDGGFDGYHNVMMIGAQQVVYAIIPECAAPQMTPVIDLLQNTTITASHEAIEASTDGGEAIAFYLDPNNQATWGWDDVQGGEVADLCVDPFLLGLDETTENGFTVQRIWSITNAAAGKNPCVPIPAGEVYFNTFSLVSAVVVDVGQSKTIEVDALADGTMGDWTLLPEDWTIPNDPSMTTPYVTFSIEGGTTTSMGPQIQVKSGDKIQLTVTLMADPGTSSQTGEADAVLVSANGTEQTATAAHFWPFIVLTPAEATQYGVTMMKRHNAHPRKASHRRGRRSIFGGLL
jgi:hypothetical protein